ncbi:MAG: bifunctional nuclease family protein [Planctomycetes bacterium]|nr:bifunctional nuclease family protein [Planctomycetota bacterium]MCK5473077.1 bifunctional nuclease family protein [Planctomycetota bacterium]
MDVEVELSRIIINEASDRQVIVLKEKNGQRTIPIVIGIVEIFAIDRKLKGIEPPRPMTHDLLADIIEKTSDGIEKVVISELRNNTFYARIHLKKDEQIIKIDSRPSDAIALAVAAGTPIYAAENVFRSDDSQ